MNALVCSLVGILMLKTLDLLIRLHLFGDYYAWSAANDTKRVQTGYIKNFRYLMTTGCGILCTIVYVSRWRCHSRGRKLPKIQRPSLWLQRYAVSGLLSCRACFSLRSNPPFCFALKICAEMVVYRMLAVFLNGLNSKNSSRRIVRNIFSVYFFYSGFKISYSEYSFVTQIVLSVIRIVSDISERHMLYIYLTCE